MANDNGGDGFGGNAENGDGVGGMGDEGGLGDSQGNNSPGPGPGPGNGNGGGDGGGNNTGTDGQQADAQGRRGVNAKGRRGTALEGFDTTLADAVTADKKGYAGVVDGAPSGHKGWGIGDSPPGLESDVGTRQARSRDISNPRSGFEKGYGLEDAVADISENSKRGGLMGQLGYEGRMTDAAVSAQTNMDIKAFPVIGPKIGLLHDLYSRITLDPLQQRTYKDVKSQALNPLAEFGLLALGEYADVPIAKDAINMINASKTRSYAAREYGLPKAVSRRDTAVQTYGGGAGSSFGSSALAAASPSIAPTMTMPDYDSWNYGSHLNRFAT